MTEPGDQRRITINGYAVTAAEFEKKDMVAIYNAIWLNMQRENDLINNRVTWAIVITAAFITAQAFIAGSIIAGIGDGATCTVQGADGAPACVLAGARETLGSAGGHGRSNDIYIMQSLACAVMTALSIAAAYVSLRCRVAVKSAIHQLSYLKYYYYRTLIDDRNLFESYLFLPRPFGDSAAHKSGNSAASILCPILLCIWSMLAVAEFVAAIIFLMSAVGAS